jgi:hypothetical protein
LGEVRTAIKNVDILLKKKKFETKKGYLDQYRSGLLSDLITKGKRQLAIIDKVCIDATGKVTTLIFFQKMKADIYRYMAEFSNGTER